MAVLNVVDDNAKYQECSACGYTWISEDPACPSCGVFGEPLTPAILIDWAEFWRRDQTVEDWLIWPLVPAGRGVALYAPAKEGKSLVIFALTVLAATGQRSLDKVTRPLVDVLYLDYEMTLDDLQERLEDLGYGPETDLSHLHYASLPSLPPLDTPEGAKAVMELVEATKAKVVIIDTFGRASAGEENDADTIRTFYRWTGLALKAAGVAFLRTDHAGKDIGKGQRGSSAKNDDVDVVWQLTRKEGGITIKATHRRMTWVPETVQLAVDDSNGWAFSLDDSNREQYPTGTKEFAELLDSLGVPVEATTRETFAAVRGAGHKARSTMIRAAIRWRKAALPEFDGLVSKPVDKSGTHPGTHLIHTPPGPTSGPTGRNADQNTDTQDISHGTHLRDPRDPPLGVQMGVGGSVVDGPTPSTNFDPDLEAPF